MSRSWYALILVPFAFYGCGSNAPDAQFAAESAMDACMAPPPEFNTEEYDHITENRFLTAKDNPLSTFSIDVDTASYSNVRRMLNNGQFPVAGAVRIEELINYFDYHYEPPVDDRPFAVHSEVSTCPWKPEHLLARIALKGKEVDLSERPPCNLVYLLDVSGSMNDRNKLPLVKSSLKMLLEQLTENDRIAIVTYAGSSGLVLPSTSAANRAEILQALDRLEAGGSTNGGEGIELAYNVAMDQYQENGLNRVILCTDGDFNVGTTSRSSLVDLIQEKAQSGVFLSVLGFGMGNYKDGTMENLADKGNGNYAYIDTQNEARKVLVEQASGTLITIAKDVKIQVDFNPQQVQAYRLIGYENRMLQSEDFLDDKKDAGEIGAGHNVTALYEIIPVGVAANLPEVQPSKYQASTADTEATAVPDSDELLTVRLRYKLPDAEESTGFEVAVNTPEPTEVPFENASESLQFASAVAAFGMLLRDSEHAGSATWEQVRTIVDSNIGADEHGYRREFSLMVTKASDLDDHKN